ncbi:MULTISPECIES: hypothetical protein [unclassified Sinorhizobium]|uniref:hypothetical protein n=1 Tax=unclassified Sinorhizobium TaxID=2613772 RepID=UPI00352498F4
MTRISMTETGKAMDKMSTTVGTKAGMMKTGSGAKAGEKKTGGPKSAKTKALAWQSKIETRRVMVDNPYFSRAHEGGRGNPVKIEAVVNIRESAIGTMAAKGHISQHQLQAALRFRRLSELLGGAGAGSLDLSVERVDAGGARDPIGLHQMDAGRQLAKCRELLGVRAYEIMSKVAGQGFAIAELGRTHRERTTLADYLKDGLDVLAEHWGYKTRDTRG